MIKVHKVKNSHSSPLDLSKAIRSTTEISRLLQDKSEEFGFETPETFAEFISLEGPSTENHFYLITVPIDNFNALKLVSQLKQQSPKHSAIYVEHITTNHYERGLAIAAGATDIIPPLSITPEPRAAS